MKVELEDIRSRIDGELDESQTSHVDSALLEDKKLQQIANKMRASQLPYRQAYNEAPVPDIPESLRAGIEALRNPATQKSPVQSIKNHDMAVQPLPTDAANHSWFKPASIAASVMIAAIIGYLGYQTGANTTTQDVSDTSIAAVDTQPKSFARTVALEGYEFMRAQRLSIDGELLLQLVYLGAEGGPLALCYMVDAEADTTSNESNQSNKMGQTTLQSHHGLNTAEWRHNGHRFVIVSDASGNKLDELSQSTRRHWNKS